MEGVDLISPMDQKRESKPHHHAAPFASGRCSPSPEHPPAPGCPWAAPRRRPSWASRRWRPPCTPWQCPQPSTWSWRRRRLRAVSRQSSRCRQRRSSVSHAGRCDQGQAAAEAHRWLPQVRRFRSCTRRCSHWAFRWGNTWESRSQERQRSLEHQTSLIT